MYSRVHTLKMLEMIIKSSSNEEYTYQDIGYREEGEGNKRCQTCLLNEMGRCELIGKGIREEGLCEIYIDDKENEIVKELKMTLGINNEKVFLMLYKDKVCEEVEEKGIEDEDIEDEDIGLYPYDYAFSEGESYHIPIYRQEIRGIEDMESIELESRYGPYKLSTGYIKEGMVYTVIPKEVIEIEDRGFSLYKDNRVYIENKIRGGSVEGEIIAWEIKQDDKSIGDK